MTNLKHTQYFTPYQMWLHDNAELDSRRNNIRISDIDTFIKNYHTGCYMLLEWKCRGAEVKFPQSEIIRQNHEAHKTAPGEFYRGYLTIRLSHETPADSDRILISGWIRYGGRWYEYRDKQITEENLTRLLKLDWR